MGMTAEERLQEAIICEKLDRVPGEELRRISKTVKNTWGR